jgi:P4 family phage/plasmid primase-like protien
MLAERLIMTDKEFLESTGVRMDNDDNNSNNEDNTNLVSASIIKSEQAVKIDLKQLANLQKGARFTAIENIVTSFSEQLSTNYRFYELLESWYEYNGIYWKKTQQFLKALEKVKAIEGQLISRALQDKISLGKGKHSVCSFRGEDIYDKDLAAYSKHLLTYTFIKVFDYTVRNFRHGELFQPASKSEEQLRLETNLLAFMNKAFHFSRKRLKGKIAQEAFEMSELTGKKVDIFDKNLPQGILVEVDVNGNAFDDKEVLVEEPYSDTLKNTFITSYIPRNFSEDLLELYKYDLDSATENLSINAPKFYDFLARQGDNDYVKFFQVLMGYSLSGAMDAKKIFFIVGDGNCGKSTFINILTELLTINCVGVISSKDLTQNDRNMTAEDVDRLNASHFGKRIIACSELSTQERLNDRRIKELTGDDRLSYRKLFNDTASWRPTFKVFVASNFGPRVETEDDKMRNRIMIIPFNTPISAKNISGDFAEIVVNEEGDHIIHWMLAGFYHWVENDCKLLEHKLVTEKTEHFKKGADPLRKFIYDKCARHHKRGVIGSVLFTKYREFIKEGGYNAMEKNRDEFYDQVEKLHFEKVRHNEGMVFKKLVLKSEGHIDAAPFSEIELSC